jgi:hypothetical protein
MVKKRLESLCSLFLWVLPYFRGSALMAQRTSIEDDIGVKSPLSIEALGTCNRLKIPEKYARQNLRSFEGLNGKSLPHG